MNSIRSYALVTGAYWGFTITDGALRMLVVLHFYKLGYDSISIAFLFLFYEFFGIVTNLFGGWIASRSGVKVTLYGGLVLQIFALLMLALLNPHWPASISVAYVMAAQALSGIAKDLTKMSAKSAIKVIVPDGAEGTLFKWVARLTGSKNALKGVGFFVGGALLTAFGFVGALVAMAAALIVVLLATVASLSGDLGRSKKKIKFTRSALEELGDQLAFRRAPVPVRRPGRLVCGRTAGVPESAWMVLLCRGGVPGALGDRLRVHPGGRARDSAGVW